LVVAVEGDGGGGEEDDLGLFIMAEGLQPIGEEGHGGREGRLRCERRDGLRCRSEREMSGSEGTAWLVLGESWIIKVWG